MKCIWDPDDKFEIEYINYCQIPNHQNCTKFYVITDIREADLHDEFKEYEER